MKLLPADLLLFGSFEKGRRRDGGLKRGGVCFLYGLPLFLLLSSCSPHPLTVQTQFLSHLHLASYHVGTPDPRLDTPMKGQRLLIQWSLHQKQMEEGALFLHLKVRFRNHEEKVIEVPIRSTRGTYLYEVIDDVYSQSGGIVTYDAAIRSPSLVLAEWRHPLWVDLIKLDCFIQFPEQNRSMEFRNSHFNGSSTF